MRTKNAKAIDANEAEHMALVKSCRCVVCGANGPSFAHHIKQGLHLCVVALCWDCHQGPHGIHGDKARWRVAHMTELTALNETLRLIQPGAGERFAPVRSRQARSSTPRSDNDLLPRIVPRRF